MLKKGICGVLAALVAAAFWSCGRRPAYVSVDGVMLGTTLHVAADVRGVSPQELYAAVMELDREAKASMSIYDPASLLSRLNRNETDSVDSHIAFNLRLADSIGSLSGGRYDVTVKPLVEAWGFAGKERVERPNVDSILEFVGREKVRIEAGRLVKDDPKATSSICWRRWSKNTAPRIISSMSAARSAAGASTPGAMRGASASKPLSTAT